MSEHPSVFQTKWLAENSGICYPHLYVSIHFIHVCHASYREPGGKTPLFLMTSRKDHLNSLEVKLDKSSQEVRYSGLLMWVGSRLMTSYLIDKQFANRVSFLAPGI